MKRAHFMLFSLFILLLTGCSDDRFDRIDPHQSFVASVNTLEPSITFFDQSANEIALWPLEKAYTGAVLVGNDAILLYGHQLAEASLYELSTGKHMQTINTGLGVTNAYFDEQTEKIFITNSKTNELTSYTMKGKLQHTVKLHNYPMSMLVSDGKLYVINYKDTILSVISTETMALLDEWDIPTSSHGLVIPNGRDELWVGGHGEGSSPNQTVDIYARSTGEKLKEIPMPLMPVGFSQKNNEIAVVSHGGNILYVVNEDGTIKWQLEIGANPFAVAHFKDTLVVAGYDDHAIYFINNKSIEKKAQTGKGPFHLLVREG
ncbi:MAG: YncE family protein [Solibacillus sp.]